MTALTLTPYTHPLYAALSRLLERVTLTHAAIGMMAILLGTWATGVDARSQGLSVEDLTSPAGPNSSQSHLSSTADGRLILSWVETLEDDREALKFSWYDAKQWSQPTTVVTLPAIYDLPKVIALQDGAIGAVWGTETETEDDYSNEVFVARSADGGRIWSPPIQAHSQVKTERYNAHIGALPGGEMAIMWSDARRADELNGIQAMMGAVMDTQGRVGQDFAVDDDICSCCQLLPTQFKDALYVTYRDHLPGDVRDIALLRWPGITAAKPLRVHNDSWVLDGCPGQNVGTGATGNRLGVAWFTAAGGDGRVKVAFTEAPETGFSTPYDVVDSSTNPQAKPQGHVKLVMLDDDHALVHWIRTTDKGPALQVALVSATGKVLAQRTLNTPDWDNAFEWPNLPSLQRVGHRAYVAWFDSEEEVVRLKAIQIQHK